MAYTTGTLVAYEAGVALSDLDSATIDEWITEADAEINLVTGRVWESFSIDGSNYEIHDLDGTSELYLEHKPIITVGTLQIEQNGVGAESENWLSYLEGRTSAGDFIVYDKEGIVLFHSARGNSPKAGQRNCRVQYTYGYATTPTIIRELSTKIVAKRTIQSSLNAITKDGGSISIGAISVSEPSTASVNKLTQLNTEIAELYGKINSNFRLYSHNYNY